MFPGGPIVSTLLAIVMLTACKGPEASVGDTPTVAPLLESADQTLPVGIYEQDYNAAISVSAGTEPYTWELPEWEVMPGGLELTPDGRIAGVPSQAGTFTFQTRVVDAAGREKRPWITLSVVLEPTVLQCGETLSGDFTRSGYDGIDPDFDMFRNHEWFAVELPNDEYITEVELQWELDGTAVVAYIEKPGEVIGSWDIEEHYVPYLVDPFDPETLTTSIHAGTNPSLSGYAGVQPLLPVFLVSQGNGDWSVTVECTDGPVFQVVPQYPTMLGEEMAYDFDVYDDPNQTTRIYTNDELPEWMIWDETTGRVTGTAMEEGSWPFTVIAESADGRVREERSIIGVYDVVDVGCDATVQGEVLEGYFEGEFTTYYDTNGYQMYRVDLGEEAEVVASSLTFTLDGLDSALLGTADVGAGFLRFFPGAEQIYSSFYPAEFELGPRVYPALRHYREAGEIYVLAAPTGLETTFDFSVACNDQPLPDFAGLPVVPLFEEMDYRLDASGGTAPYGWSAAGMPPGLQVTGEGRLTGSGGDAGEYSVDLTVTDKEGVSRTESYPLYVGYDAACEGELQVQCGDTVEGTFNVSYFADPSYSEASTARLCLIHDTEASVGFTVESFDTQLRVDIADPGRTTDQLLYESMSTYVAFVDRWDVEGVGLNPYSFPNILDYRDMPIHVTIRAFDDGDWKASVACE
jgi:hypothetical protein